MSRVLLTCVFSVFAGGLVACGSASDEPHGQGTEASGGAGSESGSSTPSDTQPGDTPSTGGDVTSSPQADPDTVLVDPGDAAIDLPTNEDYRIELAGSGHVLGQVTYSLLDAPRGMRIQPRTGIATWHPTVDQQGAITITVQAAIAGGEVISETLPLNVVPGSADAVGIYVAPDGSDSGDGSAADPFATISKAAAASTPGDTIYVRGGIYRNATYGDGDAYNWDPAVRITRDGSSDAWITYRPLGGEWAKVEYDASDAFKINASYIIVEGFEIEGPAASLTYAEAMAMWWDADCPHLICGSAMTAHEEHAIIRNMVVHHAGSRGMGAYSTDHITLEGNIVYNNSWWTLHGTHGISIPTMTSTDGNATALKNIVRNNVAFGNEQRIFSRVWNGGDARLVVDEGYGIHLQDSLENHVGRGLVENNISAFNGKAGIGLFGPEDVTIRHNATYVNGLTTLGTSGLILQGVGATIENNLFHAQDGHDVYQGGSDAVFSANYAVVGTSKELPAGLTAAGAVFVDPEKGDFSAHPSLSGDLGVPADVLTEMKQKLDDYGIVIEPSGYEVDYEGMTQAIIESTPAGTTVDRSSWPDEVRVDFPAGSTHPAAPSFVLEIRHPY